MVTQTQMPDDDDAERKKFLRARVAALQTEIKRLESEQQALLAKLNQSRGSNDSMESDPN